MGIVSDSESKGFEGNISQNKFLRLEEVLRLSKMLLKDVQTVFEAFAQYRMVLLGLH